MKTATNTMIEISLPAAWLSIAFAAACLLLLASLRILSPEFDPSWRMVSEYANGHYSWVLSLMFASWALSSWALAFAIRSQLTTTAGKIGLGFLVVAGLGEAMAVIFDINNQPLHDIAGYIGILSLPIAAVLISTSLGRMQAWTGARKMLLWLAHCTWISVLLLVAALVFMTIQFVHIYGNNLPQQAPATLPPGVTPLVGWANRLLVLVYCLWVIAVGWQARKQREPESQVAL
jgi:hypothetical protein